VRASSRAKTRRIYDRAALMTQAEETDRPTRTYAGTLKLCAPIVTRWGRLEVSGLDALPAEGPVLLAGNHDSYWDPIVVGVSSLGRRQIRALAKASLWKVKGLDRLLDGMGQIPIERGQSDTVAFARAIERLRAGACIGIFPEGTRSLGRHLRARSGIGRLAEAVPEAAVVCCAVTGSTDVPRFPRRPRLRVEFFDPAEGGLRSGEAPSEFAERLLAEIRKRAPIVAAGRRSRSDAEMAPA
jgi:1-acyl-sn-glycerol-3-phosphate acyltransferase